MSAVLFNAFVAMICHHIRGGIESITSADGLARFQIMPPPFLTYPILYIILTYRPGLCVCIVIVALGRLYLLLKAPIHSHPEPHNTRTLHL